MSPTLVTTMLTTLTKTMMMMMSMMMTMVTMTTVMTEKTTTATITTTTQIKRRQSACNNKVPNSCRGHRCRLLFTLLAVATLGANVVKSETKIMQVTTTATAAAATSMSSGEMTTQNGLITASSNATANTTTTTTSKPSLSSLTTTTTSQFATKTRTSATKLTQIGITTEARATSTSTTATATIATIATATATATTSAAEKEQAKIISTTYPPTADTNPMATATMLNDNSIETATQSSDEEDNSVLLPHLGTDILTKGFSIPTFLPPFPVFAAADLPAYRAAAEAAAAAASTVPPGQLFNEQHLYLDAYNMNGEIHQQLNQHAPRRNLSLPAMLNITAQLGNHAYMPCQIRRLSDKPVSWVRMRDEHIISVDETTFIGDERFQAIYQEENDYTWSLQIKYVRKDDEGWYECQMATEPKLSAKVYLVVVTPKTELIGDQSRFVKAGSKVALHCIVRGTLDPPKYIIWFRGKTKIPDSDDRTGWYTQIDRNIFGNVGDNQNTIGSLIIPFVRKEDSGNYTCQPSNSAAVFVDLHVLSGEYSASAIMSGAARNYLDYDNYGLRTFYLLSLSFLLSLPLSLSLLPLTSLSFSLSLSLPLSSYARRPLSLSLVLLVSITLLLTAVPRT